MFLHMMANIGSEILHERRSGLILSTGSESTTKLQTINAVCIGLWLGYFSFFLMFSMAFDTSCSYTLEGNARAVGSKCIWKNNNNHIIAEPIASALCCAVLQKNLLAHPHFGYFPRYTPCIKIPKRGAEYGGGSADAILGS